MSLEIKSKFSKLELNLPNNDHFAANSKQLHTMAEITSNVIFIIMNVSFYSSRN